jgi:hypothetical protein
LINAGKIHDTSELAVESIGQWWVLIGKERYPDAKELVIYADGNSPNGSRNRGKKSICRDRRIRLL